MQTATPFAPLYVPDRGVSTLTSIIHLRSLSWLLQEGSESLDDASVSPRLSLTGIILTSTELSSLLLSDWSLMSDGWKLLLMLQRVSFQSHIAR